MPEPLDLNSAEEPKVTLATPLNSIQRGILEGEIIERLREIFDPEIPVNIYDLGLIYGIDISDEADALVTMTLTSPACPVAESLPIDVEKQVAETPGVRSAKVNLVWDPPFSIDRMPDHVKLELGLF